MINRLHNIWSCMRQRCNNPKNPAAAWYHDKGVRLCQEWEHSFAAFAEWALENGYDNDLTIDRLDPDGNYCPENCRWISRSENSRRVVRGNTKKARRENYGRKEHTFDGDKRTAGRNEHEGTEACVHSGARIVQQPRKRTIKSETETYFRNIESAGDVDTRCLWKTISFGKISGFIDLLPDEVSVKLMDQIIATAQGFAEGFAVGKSHKEAEENNQ